MNYKNKAKMKIFKYVILSASKYEKLLDQVAKVSANNLKLSKGILDISNVKDEYAIENAMLKDRLASYSKDKKTKKNGSKLN